MHRPKSAIGTLLLTCAAAGRAWAHGAVPAPATFTNPPPLQSSPTDGGDQAFAAYPFPVADVAFEIRWEDGDVDDMARHSFYYLDHAPPLVVGVTDLLKRATPIPESGDGIWASCTCAADMGTCPDVGVRRCDNQLSWNTSGVAPGAYWVIAVTRDPPFDIYRVSAGPVRIAHGGAPPPAVILVRPDGFGSFDAKYRLRWLLDGTPPFRVDLAYALADAELAEGGPFTPIASNLPLEAESDASFGFDWDISGLPGGRLYHVRASVEDATGARAFSASRAGVTVFHPGDIRDLSSVSRPDLGEPGGNDTGCSIGSEPHWLAWPYVLVLAALAMVAARTRRV